MKILFLNSDPIDVARLRLGQESRDIREQLQLARCRDQFVLESRESIRLRDITQAIFDIEPQIVHFAGHGITTGELCFEDEDGNKKLIQPDMLARLFKEFADYIKCVVLNTCHSEISAKAISKHIPFVIGMNNEIGDKAAIAFSAGFYKALGANQSIEAAYRFGCLEMEIQGADSYSKPILHVSSKEAKESTSRWQLTLNATLDDLDEEQIGRIMTYLRQVSGDASLELKKIERGSVKLTLEGSTEGLVRIKELFESGELTEILGIPVQDIEDKKNVVPNRIKRFNQSLINYFKNISNSQAGDNHQDKNISITRNHQSKFDDALGTLEQLEVALSNSDAETWNRLEAKVLNSRTGKTWEYLNLARFSESNEKLEKLSEILMSKTTGSVATILLDRFERETFTVRVDRIPSLLAPIRRWLDSIEIKSSKQAKFISKLIPSQCPFERDILLFGRVIARIPPLCKINPFYNELMGLRFRALCYLVDVCGEDIAQYL